MSSIDTFISKIDEIRDAGFSKDGISYSRFLHKAQGILNTSSPVTIERTLPIHVERLELARKRLLSYTLSPEELRPHYDFSSHQTSDAVTKRTVCAVLEAFQQFN